MAVVNTHVHNGDRDIIESNLRLPFLLALRSNSVARFEPTDLDQV